MRVLAVILTGLFVSAGFAYATETVEDLRTKIDGNRTEIQKIESEIKQYESALQTVQGKKQTLQTAISELDYSRKKMSATIQLTQSQINQTQSKISSLDGQINNKLFSIKTGLAGLSQSLRALNEIDELTFVEVLLRSDSLANAWTAADSLQQYQNVVGGRVDTLQQVKQQLESSKTEKQSEEQMLRAQKEELDSHKLSLDINRQETNSLLSQTKNKETEYQKLLATKRKAKQDFEAELVAYEAQLKYVLDPTSLPTAGKGVLSWPLASVYITQYFGNTAFASTGAYNGQGHNGIDLRAVVGTRVNAAHDGVVKAIGNTDAYPGCYSYGKWVLIDHRNGLTTLYGHLSTVSVSAGESVSGGQLIGYSGNTGYSTGPHLHFTVFASSGVRVVRMGDIKKQTNCTNAQVPVAPTEAYLNPLTYL